ncbi:MAG TPA: hypothetical protein VKZ51_12865 [Cyclobacteriaceae bacterium]|nr:hypothetical protein [Cyclobacteriaceae bacterium]
MKKLSAASLDVWLRIMAVVLAGASAVSYLTFGPYFSPDTVNYFHFAGELFNASFWSGIYAPLYPFLLFCLTSIPGVSMFTAAHLLILAQYGLGLLFLFKLGNTLSQYQRFQLSSRSSLTSLLLICYHTWWSFRIVTWAHADAGFYALLIVWFYFMTKNFQNPSPKNRLVFALLGAVLIWLKPNGFVLVPFFFLMLVLDRDRKKWLIPLGFLSGSFLLLRLAVPHQLLDTHLQDGLNSGFRSGGLDIFASNLGAFFKTSLGFFVSDLLSDYIPSGLAMLGGGLLLVLLAYLALAEIVKGIGLASVFYLFGWVYLLCLLVFQQIIGFEEVNYRTLFPFFLPMSWYIWLKLLNDRRPHRISALALAALLCAHTLVGQVWLFKREEVNSLFAVERLKESRLMGELDSLGMDALGMNIHFFSDKPATLGLLLNDPSVSHYHPLNEFVRGKNRGLPEPERERRFQKMKEDLEQGEAALVLFGKTELADSLAGVHGLVVRNFGEGTVIYADKVVPEP